MIYWSLNHYDVRSLIIIFFLLIDCICSSTTRDRDEVCYETECVIYTRERCVCVFVLAFFFLLHLSLLFFWNRRILEWMWAPCWVRMFCVNCLFLVTLPILGVECLLFYIQFNGIVSCLKPHKFDRGFEFIYWSEYLRGINKSFVFLGLETRCIQARDMKYS